jgi:hypothetical protein
VLLLRQNLLLSEVIVLEQKKAGPFQFLSPAIASHNFSNEDGPLIQVLPQPKAFTSNETSMHGYRGNKAASVASF